MSDQILQKMLLAAITIIIIALFLFNVAMDLKA